MTYRIETEEELEYKYGDWEEERVVSESDRSSGEQYISYGQPLRTYQEFLTMNQDKNWVPNWPRN